MRLFVVLAFMVLVSCAPKSPPVFLAEARGIGTQQTVFALTARERDPVYYFGTERSENPAFGRFTVSVPPEREPGSLVQPRNRVDPNRHFLLTDIREYESSRSFQSGLSREFRALPRGQREAVIYVHGFNNSFADGVYRIAQLAHDYQIPAVALSYSWPSAGNPLAYQYDRESSLTARDGLERMIRDVRSAGADQVVIVAHSMGAFLTMETLRQIAIAPGPGPRQLVDGVMLISPDIDIDVFRSQARRIERLPQPFFIFSSQRDRALRLSAQLTGQQARLGNTADIDALAEFEVTVIDLSAFSSGPGLNHFTLGTSSALVQVLNQAAQVNDAFATDGAGTTGLLPGTILTVQNATQVILSAPGQILTGQ